MLSIHVDFTLAFTETQCSGLSLSVFGPGRARPAVRRGAAADGGRGRRRRRPPVRDGPLARAAWLIG